MASNDIAKILPPRDQKMSIKFTSKKLLFVQSEKQQWHSILKNFALLKDNDFVISTKIILEHIHGWYIQKGLYCKYCAKLFMSLVNCRVGKNCQKPGKRSH